MYAAFWRLLPGPTPVKAILAVILVIAVVMVLFVWVFPWAEARLPFLNVTVDQGSAAAGASGPRGSA